MNKRVFLIVLDSFGIGNMPDAADFGDEGSNTLLSVSSSSRFSVPNMKKLGLFNIDEVSCGEKENGDVEPVCGNAEGARIGVIDQRNENEPKEDARKLYAPEGGDKFGKPFGFDRREKNHGVKEKLHVLPDGFVHSGNEGCGETFPRPVKEKVQQCTQNRNEEKACKLPADHRFFHSHAPMMKYHQYILHYGAGLHITDTKIIGSLFYWTAVDV